MALKTFVKISNVSNLSDARYCAGMGVDILGFNIDPTSAEKIEPEEFNEITEWVAGVAFAGEFHNAGLEEIKQSIKAYPISYIEISNMELVEQVGLLGLPIVFKINVNSSETLASLKSTFSYLDELAALVVVKSENPELTKELDEYLSHHSGNVKLLKGYDVTPIAGIEKYAGLEMEATKEEKPGYKDYGEIMDVLEVLDED